jgi:Cu+-exporting ATPase
MAEELESRPGLGLLGSVDGKKAFIGSPRLVDLIGADCPEVLVQANTKAHEQGLSAVFLGWDGTVKALISLGDRLRPGAADLVAQLKGQGLQTWLVTGDSEEAAQRTAEALGVDGHRGNVLPVEKVSFIEGLIVEGARVAMVGDGINDAPSLVTADLGIAVLTALEPARKAADVALLGDLPRSLPAFLHLSQRTIRTMHRSLGFAVLYNMTAVPLAVAGVITPLIAVTAMMASSLAVVLNSMLLLRDADEAR